MYCDYFPVFERAHRCFYVRFIAGTYPEPEDKELFVKSHQYSLEYESFVPNTYPWPGMV